MSKKTSDKQTYSVDEMMERLREGDREKRDEGELVTREDGTQVVRVKKRKRRSQQKKIEEAKKRRRLSLVRTVAIVTIPLVLGLAALLLLARYHSSSFQDGITSEIWNKTRGHAKFTRLSPLGTRVKSNSLTLNWPDGEKLDSLRATGIRGDLDLLPFVQGKLRGSELKAETGHLVFSLRDDRKVSAPKAEALDTPGFKRYSSNDFSFYFGKKNSAFRLEGANTRFIPNLNSRQLLLEGGTLFAGAWGEVDFQRGTLEFSGNTMKVASLRFEEKNRHVILEGSLNLKDSLHSLSMEVVNGNVQGIAGFGLENLLQIDLTGSTGTLVFRPWNLDTHEVTLTAASEYLTLKNFAFLEVLEEVYGEPRFNEFEFEVEQGFEISRGSKSSELRNIELREEGVLALRGSISSENGSLGGKLQIGLPSFRKFAFSHYNETFFKGREADDGFYWFDVSLSGTAENPKDDFWNYFQTGSAPTGSDSSDLFDDLTR